MDRTDCTMSSFDYKKEDESDPVLLENKKIQMASSHQIKNIFDHIAVKIILVILTIYINRSI